MGSPTTNMRHAWSVTPSGVVVNVRLTPKGGRDAIDGIATLADGSRVLRARVRAAPSDGAASLAMVRLLATVLGVAPGRVRLVSGETGRIKRTEILGDPAVLVAALEKITR
jgi:uncharacterized protein YggU (UPF0235/DUF167 family)